MTAEPAPSVAPSPQGASGPERASVGNRAIWGAVAMLFAVDGGRRLVDGLAGLGDAGDLWSWDGLDSLFGNSLKLFCAAIFAWWAYVGNVRLPLFRRTDVDDRDA